MQIIKTNNTEEQLEEENQNNDLISYSISSWYNNFQHCTVDTKIVNIPVDVVKMFQDDDIDIENVQDVTAMTTFTTELEKAIQHFGGSAFIKNNWHAPKDAAMFSLNHLLKVTNAKDVLQYINCSEELSMDFEKKFSNPQFCIAVRKWIDLHPASEFRCIVVHKRLIAITPRDWPKYYSHFAEDGRSIVAQISTFFENNITSVFPATHYVFDVVLLSSNNVVLWDFGLLNEDTKLYAFLWQEIKEFIQDGPRDVSPVFRYIEDSVVNLQPLNNYPPFSNRYT